MPLANHQINKKETQIVKDLPILSPETSHKVSYTNAIKAISLDTAHALSKMGNVARERLEYHVLRGEKWALELYFKIFTQLFDKSWLSRVDLTDIQLKMDSNADKEELIRMLMNKLLGLGTIEVTEAKDIIKMLTTLSFNDSVKQSIAMKLPESDVVKIRDMIRIVENNK